MNHKKYKSKNQHNNWQLKISENCRNFQKYLQIQTKIKIKIKTKTKYQSFILHSTYNQTEQELHIYQVILLAYHTVHLVTPIVSILSLYIYCILRTVFFVGQYVSQLSFSFNAKKKKNKNKKESNIYWSSHDQSTRIVNVANFARIIHLQLSLFVQYLCKDSCNAKGKCINAIIRHDIYYYYANKILNFSHIHMVMAKYDVVKVEQHDEVVYNVLLILVDDTLVQMVFEICSLIICGYTVLMQFSFFLSSIYYTKYSGHSKDIYILSIFQKKYLLGIGLALMADAARAIATDTLVLALIV